MCLRLRYLDDLKTWNWILGWDICMWMYVMYVDVWMDGWMEGMHAYIYMCVCAFFVTTRGSLRNGVGNYSDLYVTPTGSLCSERHVLENPQAP